MKNWSTDWLLRYYSWTERICQISKICYITPDISDGLQNLVINGTKVTRHWRILRTFNFKIYWLFSYCFQIFSHLIELILGSFGKFNIQLTKIFEIRQIFFKRNFPLIKFSIEIWSLYRHLFLWDLSTDRHKLSRFDDLNISKENNGIFLILSWI